MQLDGPQADELLRMSGPQGTRAEFALLRMAPHPVLRRLAQPGMPGRYGRLRAGPVWTSRRKRSAPGQRRQLALKRLSCPRSRIQSPAAAVPGVNSV